jgi:mannose-6-phosphate isomerase-like protein (cupin superfamily)
VAGYALLAMTVAWAFPPPLPDASLAPRVGDVLVSQSEGVRQTVLAENGDFLQTELVLLPGGKGPPFPHSHRGFEEFFAVDQGTLGLELDGQRYTLTAGQSLRARPGMVHRPFNAGTVPVVMGARAYAGAPRPFVGLPKRFATCLSQLYRFADTHGGGSVLLQLSLMQGYCDIHFSGLFGAIQPALFVALQPIARLAGLHSFYRYERADVDRAPHAALPAGLWTSDGSRQ